jgi:hypothetical protein
VNFSDGQISRSGCVIFISVFVSGGFFRGAAFLPRGSGVIPKSRISR